MRLAKIITIAVVVGAAAMLAACGSTKDANKSNFTKTINAALAKECIAMGPFTTTELIWYHGIYPVTASKTQGKESFVKKLDALAAAGLLDTKKTKAKPPTMFGDIIRERKKMPATLYSLTQQGKVAQESPKSTKFCAGHYQVDKVLNFTEPADMMGRRVSQVRIRYSATDVPDWARHKAIGKAFPKFADELSKTHEGTAQMQLTSDGWEPFAEFGHFLRKR